MLEIIILQQAHPNSELSGKFGNFDYVYLTPEEEKVFNLIADSQYQIAKFLELNPNVPVILETHKKLEHGQYPDWDEFVSDILFPNGLSNLAFEELDFNQKVFLATRGGCAYAVFKNIIKQTYSDHPTLLTENLLEKIRKIQEDKQVKYSEKVKVTALHGQMREYFALENAKKVAEQTGKGQVIVVYGKTHVFRDVQTACFPQLTLREVDTYDSKKYDRYGQQLITDIQNARPLVNCTHLALGLNMPLSLRISNDTITPSSADQAMQYGATAGTIALAGLAIYGLFNCLRWGKEKIFPSVSASAHQPDKRQRKHRK